MEVVEYIEKETYVILRLNNGKANAISNEVLDTLNNYFDMAEKANKIVILTGQPGMFSGGYDLKEMKKGLKQAMTLVTKGSEFALRMLSFPLPIISACSGHAIAKGSFILLCSDYRIGVEGDFKLGLNEVAIGMTMHFAGITIAEGRLSPVYLNRCVNNAEIFNSKEAKEAGFLDKIVPNDALMGTAEKVASMMSGLNLNAHKATKLRVRKNLINTLKEAIEKDKQGMSFEF